MDFRYSYTDAEWLILKEKNSQEAFLFVYRKNFALVYHYAKKMLENTCEAEDITSESFVKLWERFAQFTSTNAIRAFLLTITKNACINCIKLRKHAQEREFFFASLQESDRSTATKEEITGIIYQYIFDEIENLPKREREVFKLSYLQGKSNEEIARLLNLTNQSVRNYKAVSLKTLRKIFQHKKNILAVFMVLIGISKL